MRVHCTYVHTYVCSVTKNYIQVCVKIQNAKPLIFSRMPSEDAKVHTLLLTVAYSLCVISPGQVQCFFICVYFWLSNCVCVCRCVSVCAHAHVLSCSISIAQSCLTVCNPRNCSLPCSSSHGIFQAREYWSRLPFPAPGHLPNPGLVDGILFRPLHCILVDAC